MPAPPVRRPVQRHDVAEGAGGGQLHLARGRCLPYDAPRRYLEAADPAL